MGEVFLCQSAGGQRVAVKTIRRERADDPGYRERRLAAGLAEGLSKIYDVGLVHRDLKPSNVLLADDGPRIIDFGIAGAPKSEALTHSGAIVGTATYMSPEQAQGARVGPPSDIFSLDLVIHYAATGEGPWGNDATALTLYRVVNEPPEINADIPADIRSIVIQCLAKSPERRPTPAQILAEIGDGELLGDSRPAPIGWLISPWLPVFVYGAGLLLVIISFVHEWLTGTLARNPKPVRRRRG